MSENQKKEKAKKFHASSLHILVAAFLFAMAGLVLSFVDVWAKLEAKKEETAQTNVFETFELKTMDGGTLSAKDLKSTKIIAVNIWGTDCPPCIKELPALEKLNNTYDDSEFRLIGIPVDVTRHGTEIIDDRLEEAKRILSASEVTFPNIIADESMDTFIHSVIAGTPTTFFLDSNGKIIKTVTGGRSYETWKDITEELLKERTQQ